MLPFLETAYCMVAYPEKRYTVNVRNIYNEFGHVNQPPQRVSFCMGSILFALEKGKDRWSMQTNWRIELNRSVTSTN